MTFTIQEYISEEQLPADFARRLRRVGLVFVTLGVVALLVPWAAGFTIELFLGILLVAGGLGQAYYAFQTRRSHLGTKILGAVLYFGAGLLLLVYPGAGLVSLALVLGILFLAEGGAKIVYGMGMRPLRGSGWVVFSGVLSILLGIVILLGLPGGAPWLVGVVFGIGLAMNGLSMIFLASEAL